MAPRQKRRQSGAKRAGPAVNRSGRRGVAESYPRRAIKDGHAWMFPDVLRNHTVGCCQPGFLELYSDVVTWGGWGSNPRPADYENYGPVHRVR